MKIKRGIIHLENLQIKSLKKAKKLAKALMIIEEECGIHEVRISVKGLFICPWINLNKLNGNEMERLLSDLLSKLRSPK